MPTNKQNKHKTGHQVLLVYNTPGALMGAASTKRVPDGQSPAAWRLISMSSFQNQGRMDVATWFSERTDEKDVATRHRPGFWPRHVVKRDRFLAVHIDLCLASFDGHNPSP